MVAVVAERCQFVETASEGGCCAYQLYRARIISGRSGTFLNS